MINSFDFRSPLGLIFTGMRYKLNGTNTFVEAFVRMTVTMNPVDHFFETTCRGIFEHLLAVCSKDGGVLSLISTYFGTVKTNGREMLYLHYLVWLYSAFHITQLRKQL